MFLLDAASVRRPDIKVLKPVVAMVWLLFCGLMVSGVQAGPRWRARDQKCPGRSLINFIPTARRIPTSSPHQNHCKHRFSSKSSSSPFGNYHISTLSSIVTHCHRSQKFVSNQQADKIPEDEILQYSWLPSPVPAVLTQHIRKQRSTIVYYGEHNLLQGAT